MSDDCSFNKMAPPGGGPPGNGIIPRHIPRGLEVLIKKAAVDPAFEKLLMERRAEAAKAIGLKLTAAEEAMLAAAPLPQLESIVAHTRVAPKFRPAFLGYAAGAMLAVLGIASALCNDDTAPEINKIAKPKKTVVGRVGDLAALLTGERYGIGKTGAIKGRIFDKDGAPSPNANVGLNYTGLKTKTDAHGDFEFRDVRPGRYSVRAFGGKYSSETKGLIFVKPGCSTSLLIKLDRRNHPVCKGVRPDYPLEEKE